MFINYLKEIAMEHIEWDDVMLTESVIDREFNILVLEHNLDQVNLTNDMIMLEASLNVKGAYAKATGDDVALNEAVESLNEGVKEFLKKMWDGIVAFFKAIGKFIADMWRKFIGVFSKKAKSVNDDTAKSTKSATIKVDSKKTDDELDNAKKEIVELRQRITSLNAQLSKFVENSKSDDAIISLKNKLAKSEDDLSKRTGQLFKAKSDMDETLSLVDWLEKDQYALTMECEDLKDKLDIANAKISELKKSSVVSEEVEVNTSGSEEVIKLKKEIEHMTTVSKESEKNNKYLTDLVEKHVKYLEKSNNENAALTKLVADKIKIVGDLNKTIATLELQISKAVVDVKVNNIGKIEEQYTD